jgi:hypothetical protein
MMPLLWYLHGCLPWLFILMIQMEMHWNILQFYQERQGLN